MIYAVASLIGLSGMASLAVDFGRVQLAKTELQNAADSAAREAARILINGSGTDAAKQAAREILGQNRADGQAIDSADARVEFGLWNPATKAFVPTSSTPNSVRVTAVIGNADNSVPTLWGKLIGFSTIKPVARATASADPSVTSTLPGNSAKVLVDGKSNPYAAGLPNNTWISDPWGGESTGGGTVWTPSGPMTYTGTGATDSTLAVNDGDKLQLDVAGTSSWQWWVNNSYTGADGDTNWNQGATVPGNYPSVSNTNAPGMAMLAVFVPADQPSGTPPPALDFSNSSSREFTAIAPKLNQVFFIGDGRTSSGQKQTIVAPPGAKRIYFGTNDALAWRDNGGNFSVTTTKVAVSSVLVR